MPWSSCRDGVGQRFIVLTTTAKRERMHEEASRFGSRCCAFFGFASLQVSDDLYGSGCAVTARATQFAPFGFRAGFWCGGCHG